MKKEKFFMYDHKGKPANFVFSPTPQIILSIQLSRFIPRCGNVMGAGKLLKKSQIEKKFRVNTVGGKDLGVCVFKGFGFDAIPKNTFKKALLECGHNNISDSQLENPSEELQRDFEKRAEKYHDLLGEKFLVFEKTGRVPCTIIINSEACDAVPI
ncbi:MAG: hypothetical protein LiPW41_681 [Parcubacteria group bacterium LiPW_41]|nr:MAG: hypothetical protein LiPW41_681 [Parcubacteria group bacterium LiPW_41]